MNTSLGPHPGRPFKIYHQTCQNTLSLSSLRVAVLFNLLPSKEVVVWSWGYPNSTNWPQRTTKTKRKKINIQHTSKTRLSWDKLTNTNPNHEHTKAANAKAKKLKTSKQQKHQNMYWIFLQKNIWCLHHVRLHLQVGVRLMRFQWT